MLYVLYSPNIQKGRSKLHALIQSLQAKRKDAALMRFNEGTFLPGILDELIYGQGLFSPKSIVVLDKVLADEEVKKAVCARLADVESSENIFIIFEESLDKKTRTKLEKHAEKLQEFEKESHAEERFKVFALADALGRRNRKALWVLYRKAKLNGVSDEEMHGILFWQVKAMLCAEQARSAKDANLNPFVYKKAQGFLRNFSRAELLQFSSELVLIYHDARRGRYELGTAIERFLLAI